MKKFVIAVVHVVSLWGMLPVGDARAQEEAPLSRSGRWESSLGEIQQASAALLDTNLKLTTERRQLERDLSRMQAELQAQRARLVQANAGMEQLRQQALRDNDAAEVSRLKASLDQRDRRAQDVSDRIAAVKLRISSAENRISLLRLRVADLEIQKKAQVVDLKSREAANTRSLKTEIGRLKEKTAATVEQTGLLREKVLELFNLEKPYVPEARKMSQANAALKAQREELQAKIEERRLAIKAIDADVQRMGGEGNAARILELEGRQRELREQVAATERQLADLRKDAAATDQAMPADLATQAERLEQQNRLILDEEANLRENIALLEYKVSTLQNYKDRNKPGPRPK